MWMITEITKAQFLALQVGRLKRSGPRAPFAHFHAEDEQRMDGARKRPAKRPRNPGRQWHRGRLLRDAPHEQPRSRSLTYEGTHDIHKLIIGERITGIAAFS